MPLRQTANDSIDYPEGLQKILEDILGSKNVYFQPPSDRKRTYPCIEYSLDSVETFYANNKPYISVPRYSLSYYNNLPDATIPNKILALPTCSFSGFHTEEHFNVYTFQLIYKEDNNNGETEMGRNR